MTDQPAETYPAQITVYCDRCGHERTGDYAVTDRMTRPQRLAAARRHLTTYEGWSCTPAGDLCPKHATPAVEEQQPAIEEQQARSQHEARQRMTSAIYDSLAAFNQVACWDVLRLTQMRLYLAEHLVETLMPEARGWVLFCRSGQTAWTLIDTYEADERPQAEAALANRRASFPAIEYRLARATTVYTADGEQL